MRTCYRLGATSFVYPGTLLSNVRRLAGRAEDIEILFFDVEDDRGLPAKEDMEELVRLKREHRLTFSLHTPLSASLASPDESRRRRGVVAVMRALEIARPLEPESVIVHVYRGNREGEPISDDVQAWRERARKSLLEILKWGIAPDRLCVEWLDYDLALLEPVIAELGLSVVLDAGHLHRDGIGLAPVLDRHLDRARIIHWHGTDPEDRDHRSLEFYPRADALLLLERLDSARWPGVLTIEVFREADFEQSLKWLNAISERITC